MEDMIAEMKTCSKCKAEQPLDEFYNRKETRDGKVSWCRTCLTTVSVIWQKENPSRAAANVQQWQSKNKSKIKVRQALWYKEHYEVVAARDRRRYANKLNASPKWANNFFIQEIYALAHLRTKVTGVKWHVDHIVPLKGKGVRGLHWEGNLQVIPAKVNMAKGNRYCSDNPHIRQSPWPQCFSDSKRA